MKTMIISDSKIFRGNETIVIRFWTKFPLSFIYSVTQFLPLFAWRGSDEEPGFWNRMDLTHQTCHRPQPAQPVEHDGKRPVAVSGVLQE